MNFKGLAYSLTVWSRILVFLESNENSPKAVCIWFLVGCFLLNNFMENQFGALEVL